MTGGPGTKDPGRINYSGVTLKMLLKRAYDIGPEQISGPDWLDSERYDIMATVAAGTTPEQFRLMLQNLVAERFELRQHRETKTLAVYLLIVAKNGPKLEAPETVPEYKDDEEGRAATRKQNQTQRRSGCTGFTSSGCSRRPRYFCFITTGRLRGFLLRK